MKTFFFVRRNPRNMSGMSAKIWRIERVRRRVTTSWGRAKLAKGRPVAVGQFTRKSWWFGTENAAQIHEASRIAEQLTQGYERTPRRRIRARI